MKKQLTKEQSFLKWNNFFITSQTDKYARDKYCEDNEESNSKKL